MSAWRRKALESFPQLQEDLNDGEFTVYQLYFELLPMVREAHEQGDDDSLRRIYSFAQWCFSQEEKDLWNSAVVAFYEHLFDSRKHWEQVIPWLSPAVINGCWSLWEARLEGEELNEIKQLVENRREQKSALAYYECPYSIGQSMAFV